MSQEARKEPLGSRDITRRTTEDVERNLYEGFEGMNYEQIRQPYNQKHIDRNSLFDERNGTKRPDAA